MVMEGVVVHHVRICTKTYGSKETGICISFHGHKATTVYGPLLRHTGDTASLVSSRHEILFLRSKRLVDILLSAP